MNRGLLLPRLLLFCSLLGWFIGTSSAEDPEAGRTVLAIFPYVTMDQKVADDDAYALYAVPDLLREGLQTESRFRLVDRSVSEGALATPDKGVPGGWTELQRTAAARTLGADFYLWGYVVRTEKGLKVFHQVFEASTGKNIHLEIQDLTDGPELIDEVAESSKSFAGWIRASLPDKPAPSVTTTPAPTPAPAPLTRSQPFSLSVPLALSVFHSPENGTFKPDFMADLAGSYPIDGLPWLVLGWSTGLQIIQRSELIKTVDGLPPTIFEVPFLFTLGFQADPAPVLSLGTTFSTGGSVLAGTRVNGSFDGTMGVTTGASAWAELFPHSFLGWKVGIDDRFTYLTETRLLVQFVRLSFGCSLNF